MATIYSLILWGGNSGKSVTCSNSGGYLLCTNTSHGARSGLAVRVSASDIVTTAIDGTTTLAESLRLSNAVLGGKVSGAGTGTETFRDIADTVDRVVATVDSSGNRTAITLDLD